MNRVLKRQVYLRARSAPLLRWRLELLQRALIRQGGLLLHAQHRELVDGSVEANVNYSLPASVGAPIRRTN